jgi:prolyl-tRNA editing enzyme YbaK/EbsC (Cys-tRNA(Pro) deacylase)
MLVIIIVALQTISALNHLGSRLRELGMPSEVHHLFDSARSVQEAADALGILVGQVASSIVLKLPNGNPLLVITSNRHRVDTELVAKEMGVEKLHRADADFLRTRSGFAIGGVPPMIFATSNIAV